MKAERKLRIYEGVQIFVGFLGLMFTSTAILRIFENKPLTPEEMRGMLFLGLVMAGALVVFDFIVAWEDSRAIARRKRIARMFFEGKRVDEIARELKLSPWYVETVLNEIVAECKTVDDAIMLFFELGLFDDLLKDPETVKQIGEYVKKKVKERIREEFEKKES